MGKKGNLSKSRVLFYSVGVGRLICTLKQLYFLAIKTVTNQIFSSAANLS